MIITDINGGYISPSFTVFDVTAQTATLNSLTFRTNARGGIFVLNITTVPGVDTIALSIEGFNSTLGTYYTLVTGAVQIGTGQIIYKLYPSIAAVANVAFDEILPSIFRFTVTHSGAGAFDYSLNALMLD
jgi:hypothetical protein